MKRMSLFLESKKQSRYLRHHHRPLKSQLFCKRTKYHMHLVVSLFYLRGIASSRLNTGNSLVWSELTSQQRAALSKGRMYLDSFACCHTEKLQIELAISPSNSILTPDQPVPALVLPNERICFDSFAGCHTEKFQI